ncbi:MAG: hypothetical protein JXR40_04545, partial [Pontiellaceae bacterium]|nr:hypothetical protein [Pontiellaceae bacterium]
MSFLELTPHGVVVCREPQNEWAAFAESEAAGLIALGGRKRPENADASTVFWKSIADRFIRALCHIPEGAELALPPP